MLSEQLESKPESDESKILKVDTLLAKSGLPADLINAVVSIDSALKSYKMGKLSEQEMKERLQNARTFNDYFRGRIREANTYRLKDGEPLYDEDASMLAQHGVVKNVDAIDLFDKNISALQKLGETEELNIPEIKRIIWEEVVPLVKG